ncbi:alpha/beta fold hydrolase [Nocardia sp. NPDC049149]|uniref:alpha/beta fold hydrolase n=1 Tax=Nocardia sp. NPDC049149 TaxID=3364315 RepID=UPI003712DDB8
MTEPVQHTQGLSEWVTTQDGRRLHAMVLPIPHPGNETTAPTVVFEAGAGSSRSSWAKVQPEVARCTGAVVYDRSGLGRSAPDPSGRSMIRMADDLNQVLDHFGPGPFILVGHSAGGPIVRLAAASQPARIAGLVLVDPVDEAAQVLFTSRFRRGERIRIGVATVLTRLGLLRFLFRGLLRDVPPDVRDDLNREGFTRGVARTMRQQARTFLDELATWRVTPPDTGSIPVTVISGARTGDGMDAATRAEAIAAHAHRATRSPAGRHVIAENSGHSVPATEPELIAREIIKMAELS